MFHSHRKNCNIRRSVPFFGLSVSALFTYIAFEKFKLKTRHKRSEKVDVVGIQTLFIEFKRFKVALLETCS